MTDILIIATVVTSLATIGLASSLDIHGTVGYAVARGAGAAPIGGTVDRHLSVFLPYDRLACHEDQLTRAAMIVMRAVPLARDALLSRIGAPPSARLPEVELDMQTPHVVVPPPGGADVEPFVLQELVSVFLSPDVGLDLSSGKIHERDREQRLDGVLRFGSDLAVAIESKVIGLAATRQAEQLRMRGVEVKRSRIVSLGWHELLEDWWALLEREMLAPAERVLMEDLFGFAEDYFSGLLPFTTLGRAGEHDLRRQRRLVALLREAAGCEDVTGETRPWAAASLMLDKALGTTSTQRVTLRYEPGHLLLQSYPAELKPQAEAFYKTDRAQRLLDLAAGEHDRWHVRPNLQLAFRFATVPQRLFARTCLEVDEYVRRWSGEDFSQIGAHHYDQVRSDLWPWLCERGYASPDEDQQLVEFLARLGHRDAHLRPGILVERSWAWAQAVDLDERGGLAGEVRGALTDLLTTLNEPLPGGITAASTGVKPLLPSSMFAFAFSRVAPAWRVRGSRHSGLYGRTLCRT